VAGIRKPTRASIAGNHCINCRSATSAAIRRMMRVLLVRHPSRRAGDI
jgi:hypothetical protein